MVKNRLKIIGLFTLLSLNIASVQAYWSNSVIEVVKDNKIAVIMTATTAIFGIIAYKLWQQNNNYEQMKLQRQNYILSLPTPQEEVEDLKAEMLREEIELNGPHWDARYRIEPKSPQIKNLY